VSEDWAAVGEAVSRRMREVKISQRDLAAISNVSVATIREIQHNNVSRHRNPRTLASLSEALGWPRRYLEDILNGRTPAEPDEHGEQDELRSRLDTLEQRLAAVAVIEQRLDQITDLVYSINSKVDIIIDIQHGRRPGS
jgi:transcriptional regulator with XRE-family HTH domain